MISPALDAEYRAASLWSDAGLYDLWRADLATCPDDEVVVDCRGNRATYRQVDDRAARLAGALRSAGVGRGDVVSVVLPNWAEYVAVIVACLKLGAVANPTLQQYGFHELRYLLELSRAKALVIVGRFRSIDHWEDLRRLQASSPWLRTILTVGADAREDDAYGTLDQAMSGEPLPETACTPGGGSDVAAVLFTSGSEAWPKGVMLTHNNVLASERGFVEALGLCRGERMFMPAPLAHATGYLHGLVMPIMVGGSVILQDRFCGADALRLINAERATCTMGSTTIVDEILAAARQGDGFHPGLARICCGGAPVPSCLVERALELGVRVHSVYGSTESAPHTMTRPGDPVERVIHTDGRAVPGTRIRIVDPVTHRTLPPGVEGEEASRGPAVFAGYLADPDRTALALDADGWYYSGDLAVMDTDGYIRVTGRIKDTILRGGENISAREVEELLLQHPAVRDVAVVAMPHPRLGESCCAFIVVQPDAHAPSLQSVRAFFRMMEVARFKTPERVECVEALPMTPSGKVRKAVLRAQIAALIAQEGPLPEDCQGEAR
ncbi:AMP-binding protein [Raineyella fluvialis]|nr:AMP-binding protein [Raineyella fluvialis]